MEMRSSGFVIFRKTSQQFEYLLLQACDDPYFWSPPKGRKVGGESDIQTAYREVKRETGFDKDDLKVYEDFQKTITYSAQRKNKAVTYHLAEVRTNRPVTLSSEHQAYVWRDVMTAFELVTYQNMQDVILECEDYLIANYRM